MMHIDEVNIDTTINQKGHAMRYKIHFESQPKQEDSQVLGDGLNAYAKLKKNQPSMDFFSFWVSDDQNKIWGGCTGVLYYGCLYIDLLWLDETLRHQRWGTELMHFAEEWGKEKKAVFATVNTMDWEGLGFYQKLGYDIEHQRTGYLNDSTMYFLRKDFK